MAEPQVTICIPTWQAEAFIDRTLGCARNQSHTNLRILVAIDESSDRTEEICRRHAAEDDRIEVIAHEHRLGWAHNVNHLLDRVESEYFFLYMHDDVIDRRYVETLLARLIARPDAASAQCEVLHVVPSGRQFPSGGRSQDGPVADRVVAALLDPGAPLRALIRTARVDEKVRFAATSMRGWNAHVPFQAALFAAGPALHVPEILYWRPSTRRDGLESSWTRVPLHELIDDQRGNARQCLDLIDGLGVSSAEATALRFALYLVLMLPIRMREAGQREVALVDPRAVAEEFEFSGVPAGSKRLSPWSRRRIAAAFANLIRVETGHHLRRGSMKGAIGALARLRPRDLAVGVPVLGHRASRRLHRRLRPLDVPEGLRGRNS